MPAIDTILHELKTYRYMRLNQGVPALVEPDLCDYLKNPKSGLTFAEIGQRHGLTRYQLRYYYTQVVRLAIAQDMRSEFERTGKQITVEHAVSRRRTVLNQLFRLLQADPKRMYVSTSDLGPKGLHMPSIIMRRRAGRGGEIWTARVTHAWSEKLDTKLFDLIKFYGRDVTIISEELYPITKSQIRWRLIRHFSKMAPRAQSQPWTPEEDATLRELAPKLRVIAHPWLYAHAKHFPHRSVDDILERARFLLKTRNRLTPEMAHKISAGVAKYGRDYFDKTKTPSFVDDFPEGSRLQLICEWVAIEPYDHPRALWSREDDEVLFQAMVKEAQNIVDVVGNFSRIAREHFPGRFGSELRVRWEKVVECSRFPLCQVWTQDEEVRMLQMRTELARDHPGVSQLSRDAALAIRLKRPLQNVRSRILILEHFRQARLGWAAEEDERLARAVEVARFKDVVDWVRVAELMGCERHVQEYLLRWRWALAPGE
ncbi:hypothetical protein HK105_204712 [Polyrhizophydium stewartii]|uniref:Myb-like domain-containing protein n=1 Tax=Polyrhizophydium stewartii TaxID=2732419 RepID=A0ABR4N8D5_9FUNG